MNEMRLLREWDAEAPPLTDHARARARLRLHEAMTAPATPVAVGRRPLLRIAVAGVATAAVATTVLVANDSSPRTQPVSATTVLQGAAAEERRLEKPIAARDDQFIYTKEVIKETPVGGGPTRTYVDENWNSVDGSKRSYVSELGHKQWVPVYGPGQSTWPPSKWTELKLMPTDPRKLAIDLRDMGGKPDYSKPMKPGDWPMVQYFLSGLLRTPVLPQGLRSAAYEALATVPGIKVVPGQKDADGRVGIGIRFVPGPGTSRSPLLVFDAKTYRYLGMRDQRTAGGKTYEQWSYVAASGVVDRMMERP
ncbi:CU044_5270 family protein [Streptomyces sp. NPDC050549]|uniref:CU044_5270 family protein n=1 Tax=Streptomyces sp. NPDC050549 TaxID=3155406 RepID=UPI00343AD16E